MRHTLLAGVAAIAIASFSAAARAQELKFKPGEDAKFTGRAIDDFKAAKAI